MQALRSESHVSAVACRPDWTAIVALSYTVIAQEHPYVFRSPKLDQWRPSTDLTTQVSDMRCMSGHGCLEEGGLPIPLHHNFVPNGPWSLFSTPARYFY